ncbi:IS1380 family transposase [Labilibacter marinus]|uniref:IS1380 family transposase n=1 Tax=Labilibacter marinus TaxID=1477105 RepID=UPI00082B3989|nr:IS1380 family transposase [Labilibacter marinus]
MKILNSPAISPFGGLNFIIEETIKLKIDKLLEENLPMLPKQSTYNWFDIVMSYWSVFFCGGDCAEDLSVNLRKSFRDNPLIKVPSLDRVLNRLKSLAVPAELFVAKRDKKEHLFSLTDELNRLNLQMLSLLPGFEKGNVILDYDNTIIFTEKADAELTYKKENGYCPGVGMVGRHVVYVENRNGKSNAHILQHETIDRMAALLEEAGITIDVIRADSASYTYNIIKSMEKCTNRIFVKAWMTETLEKAITKIEEWEEIKVGDDTLFWGSTSFTPFVRYAKGNKEKTNSLKEYRIVVTKEARRDGQLNLFTGEAYNYSAIMTNDFEMTDDEVVFFYNARGAREREFDVLKNDFGWDRMPFSKLEQNSVFLIVMAMCKNLYVHMIEKFSGLTKVLSPHFRIKKFIFRFICVPGKWVCSGRTRKLRLYGSTGFKT